MPGGKKKYRPPSQVKTDAKILSRVLANQIWQQIERIIASLVAQMVKSLPAVQKTQVQSLDREDPLEKGMATHSSVLAGEFCGQRSLVGCRLWGCREQDMADRLTHSTSAFSASQLRKFYLLPL